MTMSQGFVRCDGCGVRMGAKADKAGWIGFTIIPYGTGQFAQTGVELCPSCSRKLALLISKKRLNEDIVHAQENAPATHELGCVVVRLEKDETSESGIARIRALIESRMTVESTSDVVY
jgi:hypothetical protein